VESLADISGPQVPPNNEQDQQVQFSICLFWVQWEKSNFSQWNWTNI